MNIKEDYQLTTSDICRQCGTIPTYYLVEYMSKGASNRNPNKKRPIGKQIWTFSLQNFDKTDWLSSTASYQEKLDEKIIDGCYKGLHISITGIIDQKPQVNIIVCIDETKMKSREELEQIFTIDGVTPNVNEIQTSIFLLART